MTKVEKTELADECSAPSSEIEGGYSSSTDDEGASSYSGDEVQGTNEPISAEDGESKNRNERRQSFPAESRDSETQPESEPPPPSIRNIPRRASNEAKIRDDGADEIDEEEWFSRGAEIDPAQQQRTRPTKRDSRDIDYADDYGTDYESDGLSDRDWE